MMRLKMRLPQWLRRLTPDDRGNALIICAATLPLLIGSAAVGVDTVQLSVARRQLQRTADSAALAGAYAKAQSQNVATAANHDLSLNNDVALFGAPVIENAPTTGPYAGNQTAVRVALAARRSTPFISFFTGSPMGVSVEATAARVFLGEFCMISLESGNETGIVFTGNASINLGCGVVSNSTSQNAITASGSASITASPVAAVGTVPPSSRYASSTEVVSFAIPQADPYSGLPTPTVPANCQTSSFNVQPNGDAPTPEASSPGVYCYRGMDIKGPITLPAGTYIIDGSSLSFGAQANVTCTGCVFILTSRTAASNASSIADLSMNGGAQLNLTAPTSGTYAGVLMYQDRRAQFGTTVINGGSDMTFRGGLYFPAREMQFNGNASMSTECVQMVARRLDFRGNGSVSNTCPANSGARAFDAAFVRLVG